MVISALHVFLIILVFLLVIVFIHSWWSRNKEGFIAFEESVSSLGVVTIPTYSTTTPVLKLYDNVFLDVTSMNLVEVNGLTYSANSPINGNSTVSKLSGLDELGVSINGIYVVSPGSCSTVSGSIDTRCSATQQTTTQTTTPSSSTSMIPWSYVTQSPYTDTYLVFVIPLKTYSTGCLVYIMDTTTQTSSTCFLYDGINSFSSVFSSSTNLGTSIVVNDPYNGQMVLESYYDPTISVYQLDHLIKFDITHQNLLLKSANGTQLTIISYNNQSTVSSSPATANQYTGSNTTSISTFAPFLTATSDNQLVLYAGLPNSGLTLIAVFYIQPGSSGYSLHTSVLFSVAGPILINGLPPSTTTSIQGASSASTTTIPTTQTPETPATTTSIQNPISDYYKMFWMMNMMNSHGGISDDYILKSQIVPPVATCPNCNGSSCINCAPTPTIDISNNYVSSASSPSLSSLALSSLSSPSPSLSSLSSSPSSTLSSQSSSSLPPSSPSSFPSSASINPNDYNNSSQNIGASTKNNNRNSQGLLLNGVSGVSSAIQTVSNDIGSIFGQGQSQQQGQKGQQSFTKGQSQGQGQQPQQQGQSQQQQPQGQGQASYENSYGAQSGNSSLFLPITTDFSKFSK